MIRFAEPADRGAIMALWSACFGDPPGALAAYFNLRHRDEYMPVWAQDGAIVGMLSMLPVALRVGGASYPGRYVFAVATDPAWRGRGISTQLLAFAHDWMRQNGVRLSALVPADQGLFDFYGRRGYKTYFYQRRLSLSPAELPLPPVGARVARCDAAAWLEARDRAFEACPFVRWGEDALAFMMNDEWLDGGGVARVDTPTGRAIAAWDWDGDQAVVRELALQGLAAPQALAALHAKLGASAYRLRVHAGCCPGGEVAPYGMIRWLDGDPPEAGGLPYLALAKE
ncbi:MAG: GNAT family N-acetyltransferase [Clostridiales bacterium]|nr:GNAT family N-acetyltransferase [Clostridiales bacterium]